MPAYAIGLDYGTNSARAIIVDVAGGEEIGQAVHVYDHGTEGVILSRDPNLARQHPADYLTAAEITIKQALAEAGARLESFEPSQVIGIGVDTTGSTPLPVGRDGLPLAYDDRFADDPAAMAWLWKDHTSVQEAAEITALAREMRPEYLCKCGGTYSSEWYFSKLLHCLRTSPKVFDAAYTWVEIADWIPASLTGTEAPDRLTRCVCAAGHKAMYNDNWGGYPDEEYLGTLDPKLAELRRTLPDRAYSIEHTVGTLTKEWAERTGLEAGIPVAAGAFDAHLGAVGIGINAGSLVKVIGTSSCDMMVVPNDRDLADVPGLCGIVDGSILPGYYGLEAGQSAFGDLLNWFVEYVNPTGMGHAELTAEADKLKPGESGLLALDWNNGNRCVLVDQRLTGLILGQTLYTTPPEIYRALVEAAAFGSLAIIERFEDYGVEVRQVLNAGGIAEKNPMVMQILADVTGKPMKISRSSQTCALGSAMAGAVVAGEKAGGHRTFAEAQKAMTGLKEQVYLPDPRAHQTYRTLYSLYKQLHDAFGTTQYDGSLHNVMKDLIALRDEVRRGN